MVVFLAFIYKCFYFMYASLTSYAVLSLYYQENVSTYLCIFFAWEVSSVVQMQRRAAPYTEVEIDN